MEEMSRRQRRAHRKCREELNKVDWEMMKKHLHTPEALQAYEKLCNLPRKNITDQAIGVICWSRPDVCLQYYYGKYAYLPFKERVLLEWADGMKELQKMLLVSKKSWVLATVGLSAASAMGLGYGNWFGNANEQKKEKKGNNIGCCCKRS